MTGGSNQPLHTVMVTVSVYVFESLFLDVNPCPGHPCVSVTLQIWLAGRQTSDRLSHTVSVRGAVTHHVHTHRKTEQQDTRCHLFAHRAVLQHGHKVRKEEIKGVVARPRHSEVKYVWTKGHEGSSINTLTLLSKGYGSDRSVGNTQTFRHTHKHFQIKPSL